MLKFKFQVGSLKLQKTLGTCVRQHKASPSREYLRLRRYPAKVIKNNPYHPFHIRVKKIMFAVEPPFQTVSNSQL